MTEPVLVEPMPEPFPTSMVDEQESPTCIDIVTTSEPSAAAAAAAEVAETPAETPASPKKKSAKKRKTPGKTKTKQLDATVTENGEQELDPAPKAKRPRKKKSSTKNTSSTYKFAPPPDPFFSGPAWFDQLAKHPVQSISPTPTDAQIECVRYVLYDHGDRYACVFVELKDKTTRYLLVPKGDLKAPMAWFKAHLAKLPLREVQAESGDYLSLQQIQNMLIKFAETRFNAISGRRGTSKLSWEHCTDYPVQLVKLLQQFALQGSCLCWAVPEEQQAEAPGVQEDGPDGPQPHVSAERQRPWGTQTWNLQDLLIERRYVHNLFAATLANVPWFAVGNLSLVPDINTIQRMLEIEEKAKTRSRMSYARKMYEKSYLELVRELDNKKNSRTKQVEVEASSSSAMSWVTELGSADDGLCAEMREELEKQLEHDVAELESFLKDDTEHTEDPAASGNASGNQDADADSNTPKIASEELVSGQPM